MTDETPDVDVDAVADTVLPLDGPYPPEAIIGAAGVLAELVRRLNHATIARRAFRYPSELDRTIGGIKTAAYGLPQLLAQLGEQLDVFHADDRLYHDAIDDLAHIRRDLDPDEMLTTAGAEAHANLDQAGGRAALLADTLAAVTRYTHHLGLREEAQQ